MKALDRLLTRLEDGALSILLLGLLGLALTSMVLRWVGEGQPFIDPLLRYGIFWLGLAGGVAAIRQGRHVQIGALARLLPPGARPWLGRAIALLSALLCLALARAGWDFVLAERGAGTEAFGGVPLWLLQLFLPFGFGWMALRFALQALGVGIPDDPAQESAPGGAP